MPSLELDAAAPRAELDGVITDTERRRIARGGLRMELPLRCVASGYLSGGCSCQCTIPALVVVAAWARELERAGGDRFFHFVWEDGVWLAYGLENGLVRGIYCPAHSAARDERSFSYSSRDTVAARAVGVGA